MSPGFFSERSLDVALLLCDAVLAAQYYPLTLTLFGLSAVVVVATRVLLVSL